jgi:hypothetical protein
MWNSIVFKENSLLQQSELWLKNNVKTKHLFQS